MNESVKNVAYYIALPYTTVLRRDEDDDVIARIEELPGCVRQGHIVRNILHGFIHRRDLCRSLHRQTHQRSRPSPAASRIGAAYAEFPCPDPDCLMAIGARSGVVAVQSE